MNLGRFGGRVWGLEWGRRSGCGFKFGQLWVVSSELWTAGSGEETFGRGDGGDPPGARDPRRTSCGRREAGRGEETEIRGWRVDHG